jgi:hypothetical protein
LPQVADNAYFLGFLYFLVSLAITLSLVAASPCEIRQLEVKPIIRGFGVALATTIVGVWHAVGIGDARLRAQRKRPFGQQQS